VKISSNGRQISTAKITVCVACGYRTEAIDGERWPHCLGHTLRLQNPEHSLTREIYLSDYEPPPYVKEKQAFRSGRRLGKSRLTAAVLA
jgi:hypothetical protein